MTASQDLRSVTEMLDRAYAATLPKMAVALHPSVVTDAIRAECKARNVPLHESDYVPRNKAYVVDLERMRELPDPKAWTEA